MKHIVRSLKAIARCGVTP